MARFHVNDSNDIKACSAVDPKDCKFASFDSVQDATAYVDTMLADSDKPLRKKRTDTTDIFAGVETVEHTMNISPTAEGVLGVVSEVGTPLVVGGSVRDSYAGAESKDVDIEVFGVTTDELTAHLRSRGYVVNAVGQQFGVLKVESDGEDFDISVPRTENKTGAKHGDFEVQTDSRMTIAEAVTRRDFTVNALMYDHSQHAVVDAVGGVKDMENKVLRHVSDKFGEDSLRVLRGFHMASRFDLTTDDSTVALCQQLRPDYENLSTERVRIEWEKFYTKSVNHSRGVDFLRATTWDTTIEGLHESLSDTTTRTALSELHTVNKAKRDVMGAAIIGRGALKNGKNPKRIYSDTLVSKDRARAASTLASLQPSDVSTTYDRKHKAAELARKNVSFRDYKTLCHLTGDAQGEKYADDAIREGIGDTPEPDMVKGADMISMTDKKPGPWVGEVQRHVRDCQYKGLFRTTEDAHNYARTIIARMG